MRLQPLSAAPDSLWRRTDFRRFWTAQSLGILGGQVSQLTLPSAAILLLRADAVAVGIVHALHTLPYLLFGLGVGVLCDRVSRRRLIVLAGAGRALVLALVPLAALLHVLTIEQLYLAAALNGTLAVVFTTATQAHLPDLVQRSELVGANTHLQLSRSGVEVSAPAISGAAIQWLGAANAILADALAHLLSASAALGLPSRPGSAAAARAAAARGRSTGVGADLRHGLAMVLGDPVLRSITAASTVLNLGTCMVQAVLLLFAYRVLDLAPGVVGAVLAVGSLGFLAGVAVTSPLSRRLGPGPTLALSCLTIGLALMAMPAASLGLAVPALAAAHFLFSMQWPIYNAIQVTLRQQATPGDMQGRVSATVRTAAIGVMPVGAMLAGLLGVRIGLTATIGVGGLVAAASALCLLPGGVARLRRLPAAPSREAPRP